MNQLDVIAATDAPRTRETLGRDLRALGLRPGALVLVHSSLSALGWVCGGAVAVVQALLDVVEPHGTLVMPAHTADNTEPSRWRNPPVPADWWPTVRAQLPAYDPRFTPTRAMGAVVDAFLRFPGVLRSGHPVVSFAALGPLAREVTAKHGLDWSLGDGSPLGRLYERDGWVLLLGVGHERNTSLHLAEYRCEGLEEIEEGSAVMARGERVWTRWRDVLHDDDLFAELGADFDAATGLCPGRVGSAACRLFRQRPAVDFAVQWLGERNARRGT